MACLKDVSAYKRYKYMAFLFFRRINMTNSHDGDDVCAKQSGVHRYFLYVHPFALNG